MNTIIKTGSRPTQIHLKYSASTPMNIRVVASDKNFPKTILWDRSSYVSDNENVLIKIPVSPKYTKITVFNSGLDSSYSNDNGIKIVGIRSERLKRELTENEIHDRYLREFVKFAEQFSFHAKYLKTDEQYRSSGGHFLIDYLDVIRDSSGKPMQTSARIKENSSYMQFSAERIRDLTVAGIFAIALHEFSHNYLNDESSNENEADLNSLIIYLGLGFPLVEAFKTWNNIYQFTPTSQNENRKNEVYNLLMQYSKYEDSLN